MQEEVVSIFVPGRVSIIGELSDLVSDYIKENPSIIPGEVIASGIDKGIYAIACKSNNFKYSYNNQVIEIKKMDELELENISKSSSFFSYVCSVALYMKKNYNVKGIDIKVIYMTLPIKKGLSSSAAVSVMVVKAFNILYNLNLDYKEIMDIAYKSERFALSMCGRLDQICAKGLSVSHIIFNENDLIINPVRIHKEMNFVICDVKGTKNTKNILNTIHSCFPYPKTEVEKKVKKMLCEDNKKIIERALYALKDGNLKLFGKVLSDAQKLIDNNAAKICKDLKGPKLHQIMNDKTIKKLSYGSKGVGSNGDGAIEILAKNKNYQKKIFAYLKNIYGLEPFEFNIKKTYKIKKAVIPIAGYGTRIYPFTRTIKKAFLPIVDEGYVKPTILKLVEELDEVGIEKILLIIGKGEEEIYYDFFKKPLSEEHFKALTDEEKEYELKIIRIGEKIIFKVQEEQLGYGHAVLKSREFANNEPVLMILGDTVYRSNKKENCIGQVLEQFDKINKPIISLGVINEEQLKFYGVAHGKCENDLIYIDKYIEKPSIDIANTLKINNNYYGYFGISIIDTNIYEALNDKDNPEIDFTKAIDIASKKNNVIGFIVDGKQYDLGNASSYKQAFKEMK